MIKYIQGGIRNPKTGEWHNIVVKTKSPNKLKEVLIGGGLILIGVAYLTKAAFKNGSYAFEFAEAQVLYDLGLIFTDGEHKY